MILTTKNVPARKKKSLEICFNRHSKLTLSIKNILDSHTYHCYAELFLPKGCDKLKIIFYLFFHLNVLKLQCQIG